MHPQVGQLLNNKYRLVRMIGEGGMGSVWEATHEMLGTTVALKFLHGQLAKRSGLVDRFLQEAQVSARIKSPHVVAVSDVDRTAEGLAFMVMELIDGQSLQAHFEELFEKGESLGYGAAFEIMLQMMEGVAAAHLLGIVHRDLKPDNVMLMQDAKGRMHVKILDFGIAKLKASGEMDRGLTRPGIVMGTPEYMAPEQAFSADQVDARADVFSLGVMFFEMLAGRRPVGGDSAHGIAAQYLSGAVTNLRELKPTIAEGLAAAVHKAMGATPPERFTTLDEFAAAIAPFTPEGAARTPVSPERTPVSPVAAPALEAPSFASTAPLAPQASALAAAQQHGLAPSTGPEAGPNVRPGGTQLGEAQPYAAAIAPMPDALAGGIGAGGGGAPYLPAYGQHGGYGAVPAIGVTPMGMSGAQPPKDRSIVGILAIAAGLTGLVLGGLFVVQRLKASDDATPAGTAQRRRAETVASPEANGTVESPASVPASDTMQPSDAGTPSDARTPTTDPTRVPPTASTGSPNRQTPSTPATGTATPSAIPTGTPIGQPWVLPTALPEFPGVPVGFPRIPGLSTFPVPAAPTPEATPTSPPATPTPPPAAGRPRFPRIRVP